MMDALDRAIASTQAHLEALRDATATGKGIFPAAPSPPRPPSSRCHSWIAANTPPSSPPARSWLSEHQNADGGWGDTTLSKSNLSTTLLCWSALHIGVGRARAVSDEWIIAHVGSLEPQSHRQGRHHPLRQGQDLLRAHPHALHACAARWEKTAGVTSSRCPSSSPLCRAPGSAPSACPWSVTPCPRSSPSAHAFHHAAPAWWNPLRWLRALTWPRIRPMLQTLQPASGGYLEATPLTSFVTMALAGAGQLDHPCLPLAVEFLTRSMREDGSWPIDTNLATWGTTLSIRASW
jgi:squalene-hopene/tetraprenyl-beta-curcumene cyclase